MYGVEKSRAHAKAEDLILVTNNTREFNRVEALDVEDWT